MPTYDYVCNSCGHEFELFQSMTDRVKRKCPECGRRSLERLIGTGAGVIFKGSGFYETDYRSDSYKKAAEAEKKSTAENTNGTAKADTSAAAKSGGEKTGGGSGNGSSGDATGKSSAKSAENSKPASSANTKSTK